MRTYSPLRSQPSTVAAARPAPQPGGDATARAAQVGAQRSLVRPAGRIHLHVADGNVQAGRVHPRRADGSQDAPPVWIGGVQRGLHQGRFSDAIGHAQALLGIRALLHAHHHNARGALAVGDDHAGQGAAQLFQRLGKARVARVDVRAAPGGDQGHRVIGGTIPVHGDAVEAALHRGAQATVEKAGVRGGRPWR